MNEEDEGEERDRNVMLILGGTVRGNVLKGSGRHAEMGNGGMEGSGDMESWCVNDAISVCRKRLHRVFCWVRLGGLECV